MPAAIGVGAVASVLGGALLGLALMGGPEDGVANDPSAAASASGDARSPSASSAGESAAATPSASPTPPTAAIIPNRAVAEVVTDSVNLRAAGNESAEVLTNLERGRRVFIIGEPAEASDLRWYRVAPIDHLATCEADCGLIGFVATPLAADDPWLEATEVACPSSPMTADAIGVLDPLEALHCYGRSEIQVTGTLDLPIHGPISPYRYSPGWLTQDHLEFMRGAWWITYRPHPDAGLEQPERGDVVRVTGHFEDPAATSCRATVDPDFFGGEIPADFESTIHPARVVLDCRASFAWSDYEVVGFEDLGECCGLPEP